MRHFTQYLIGAVLVSVLVVCIALAGGYQLNEHGARAMGMGGAFVARASDPSAIYFNPAGLAFQKGINIMGGGTFIFPSSTFKPYNMSGYEVDQVAQTYFPPNLYGTYALDDQWVVGLGAFSPYGLGTEWNKGWIGNEHAIRTSLQTFYINPTIAYKITDEISVGLGVSYVYSTVFMSRSLAGGNSPSVLELDGNGSGYNVNIGGIYKPMENLSVGFSYRMKTDIDFSGDIKIFGISTTPTGKATIPMPGNFIVGAAYEVLPDFTIEGDFQYVQWSEYYKLSIEVTPALPGIGGTILSYKRWDDSYIGRLGLEYQYNNDLTLRCGFIYDITPQPASKMEPMLPDADRAEISIGAGYKINDQISVDFAYMLILLKERTSYYTAPVQLRQNMGGTYNGDAHLFGFDISYSF